MTYPLHAIHNKVGERIRDTLRAMSPVPRQLIDILLQLTVA